MSDALDKLGMAPLAGNLDFPAALWCAKAQAAAGAFKIFILLSLLEFGSLERKPLRNRMPQTQKLLVFLLACSKVTGKNTKQSPKIHQIRHKNQRPEKQLCNYRKKYAENQAGQCQLVCTVAAHHPILKLL